MVATRVHTTLVPGPVPRTTVDEEWCHQTRPPFTMSYCGVPLPADEPFCGAPEHELQHVGSCPKCGRPRCPDCIAKARRWT